MKLGHEQIIPNPACTFCLFNLGFGQFGSHNAFAKWDVPPGLGSCYNFFTVMPFYKNSVGTPTVIVCGVFLVTFDITAIRTKSDCTK